MALEVRLDSSQFKQIINESIERARKFLDSTSSVEAVSTNNVSFDNLFHVSDHLANVFAACVRLVFEEFGFPKDLVAEQRALSVVFSLAVKTAAPLKETRTVKGPSLVTTYASGNSREAYTERTETVFKYVPSSSWSLGYFEAANVHETKVGSQGDTEFTFYRSYESNDPSFVCDPIGCNLTWFNLKARREMQPLDRRPLKSGVNATPARSMGVKEALENCGELMEWISKLRGDMTRVPVTFEAANRIASKAFLPVAPIFAQKQLIPADVLLQQFQQSLQEVFRDGAKTCEGRSFTEYGLYYTMGPIVCSEGCLKDAKLVQAVQVIGRLCQSYRAAVEYIESLMMDALCSAIGKVNVSHQDFTEYMKFHNRKVFDEKFSPKSFCYAIRRPLCDPEGVVSIESTASVEGDPVQFFVREDGVHKVSFSLNAGTNVEMQANMYLHGMIDFRFGKLDTSFSLSLRARQFSNFICMLGRYPASGLFEPSHAIFVKNRDEITVPIELAVIPSPKEFANAIQSLSVEQQQFAKAYRGMQLSSTLFAVCVIHVKPQLELLLRAPSGSLTKEIRLTQDALNILVRYQIPGDLLSCSLKNPSEIEAVENIKKNCSQVQKTIGAVQLESFGTRAGPSLQAILAKISKERAERDAEKPLPEREWGHSDVECCILEVGSFTSRAGFAGSTAPRYTSVTVVGRPRHTGVMVGMGQKDSYSGGDVPTTNLIGGDAAAGGEEGGGGGGEEGGGGEPSGEKGSDSAKSEVVKSELSLTQMSPVQSLRDYTTIPNVLEQLFSESLCVRPVILNVKNSWVKRYCPSLIDVHPRIDVLEENDLKDEKNVAFDLLDALSRSGALPLCQSELHVVVVQSHGFEKSIIQTVLEDNVNPIDRIEETCFKMASVIHDVTQAQLFKK